MGRETPIKTVISVATMEATQQKENKHNVASDYQIKHYCEVHPQNVNSLNKKVNKIKSSCVCVCVCVCFGIRS